MKKDLLYKNDGSPVPFVYSLDENGLTIQFGESKSFIGLAQLPKNRSFGVMFPQPQEIISFAITIFLTQIPSGFFQEIGKELYQWIKKKTKKIDAGKRTAVSVLVKGTKNELSFLFEESFDNKTFKTAWEKMTTFPIDVLQLKDNKAEVIYDQKKKVWQVIGPEPQRQE